MATGYSASALLNVVRQQLAKPQISSAIHNRLQQLDILKPFRGGRAGRRLKRNNVVCYVNKPLGDSQFQFRKVDNAVNIGLKTAVDDNDGYSGAIQTVVSIIRPVPSEKQHGCNPANLCRVMINNRPKLKAALLNAHHVCKDERALTLCEYVKDHCLDLFCLTETWLKEGDDSTITELTPPGYSIQHIDRPSRGGGVAIIHKDSLQTQTLPSSDAYKSFEHIERKIINKSTSLLLAVLYRPPPNSTNELSVSLFLDEFGSYLESVLLTNSNLVICGDFNFHVDSPSNTDAQKFLELIDSTGLQQHVETRTHKCGHTLDLVLTRDSSFLTSTEVRNDLLSDHYSVFFELDMVKPALPKKEVIYRKIKSIDLVKFRSDIVASGLPDFQHQDLDVVIDTYNSTMLDILDRHAPIKKRIVSIHPDAPWMNDDIKQKKREKRKAERMWRNTGLTVHMEIYIHERKCLNSLISKSKKEFYQQHINESPCGQKALFKCVDNLLGRKKVTSLPTHDSAEELCERMADFFTNKIHAIHEELAKIQEDLPAQDPDPPFDDRLPYFCDFSPVTEDEIHKIIRQAAPKSCCLDPIPTQLLKECLDLLVPLITRMVNQSFSSGYVPKSFKLAAVTPLLKKANLIPEILKNFRPISNLPFLSKVLEKAAGKQLIHHKEVNDLREKLQSAYREYHSTETALLRIHNDLVMSMDKKQCVLMVMLDLSAAFDTVHHKTLLDRLSIRYGIKDTAHTWITSYLTDRRQFISIKGERSTERTKDCDVPQGSVLGPNLYEDYSALPVGEIFRKHGIEFHIYADDTQAYLPFNPGEENLAVQKLELCLQEIRYWMAQNWLKLNDAKTEFILFGNKNHLKNVNVNSITLGTSEVPVKDCVKSIGAHLDKTLSMEPQIASTCRSAWFYLHQISKIRKYLTEDQTQSVIHAHVTSRLDQNNSLLIGLPKKQTQRLQIVQNAAARLIAGLKKRDHVTPTLEKLHWLPVDLRILYKVLAITYKSLNGLGPAYLSELLTEYIPSRSLRSASENRLCVPSTHYVATGKRAFGAIAPKEWNKLPIHIRKKDSFESFKKALKTHFFVQAYG